MAQEQHKLELGIATGQLVGLTASLALTVLSSLPVLGQTAPSSVPSLARSATQTAYLNDLLSRVSSKLYQSRIQHQPDTYISVGEASCQQMREQGYDAVLRQTTQVSAPRTYQNQPQGNGSYRGILQVQMGQAVLESARKHLCPDVKDVK
jgi:hypothetical protein